MVANSFFCFFMLAERTRFDQTNMFRVKHFMERGVEV